MNTTTPTARSFAGSGPLAGAFLPGSSLTDDDSALIAYLARLEADERVRELSEEY